MRAGIALISLAVLASGCTAAILERTTVNQAMSVTDMRYQEVMDNLAVIAHNTGTLPSFALNGGGQPQETNQLSVDAKTTWDSIGFMQQLFGLMGKHNPQVSWDFEPVASNFQLAALRYACIWAVCGQEYVDPEGLEYLRAPRRGDIFPPHPCPPSPRPSNVIPHFDVQHQLEHIPPHWLHCGKRGDVSKCACYKAKCCDTYVWVDRQDLKWLSDFTLVILDIATRDPAYLASAVPTAQVVVCAGLPTTVVCTCLPTTNCRPLADPQCSACKSTPDCQCTFDPNPKPNQADCSMKVADCKNTNPPDPTAPGLTVTETWNIYQEYSDICKGKVFDCEPPQISCGDFYVYSGDFVTKLPYVYKNRPPGNPCNKNITMKEFAKLYNVPLQPAFDSYHKESDREADVYNAQSQEMKEAYDAANNLVVPQFEPPAAYGNHAAPPTYPNR